MQAVAQRSAALRVVRPHRDHQLGGYETRHARDPGLGQRRQPTLGDVEIQSFHDRDDAPVGHGRTLLDRAGRQERLDRLFWMPLVQQLAGEPPAHPAHPLRIFLREALQEILAKARMATHQQRIPPPRRREMPRAQRGELRAGLVDPERGGTFDRHLLQHRTGEQKLAFRLAQMVENVPREVSVQRVGQPAARAVGVARTPGLEHHAGHPPPRRGDRLLGREIGSQQAQGVGRLGLAQRQIALIDHARAPAQLQSRNVERELTPARYREP